MVKSRIVLDFITRRAAMKIYDYHGKKNMCGNRIKIARAARKVS